MARYNIVLDDITHQIPVKEVAESGNNHLVWMEQKQQMPLIILGTYLGGDPPIYTSDLGGTWKYFDMSGYTGLERFMGAGITNTYGQNVSKDGTHISLVATDSTGVSTTLRFMRSVDGGSTWNWQDVSSQCGYSHTFAGDTGYVYHGGGFGGLTNGRGYSTNNAVNWTMQNAGGVGVSKACSLDGSIAYEGMTSGVL